MRDFKGTNTLGLLKEQALDIEIDTKLYEDIIKRRFFSLKSRQEKKLMENMNDDNESSKYKNLLKMKNDGLMQLEKDAEEGDVEAQFNLASYYMPVMHKENTELSKAFQWYKKAAEQGMKEAQYNVACFYMNGMGVADEDEEESVCWYKKSAEQGFLKSKICLAICYEHGLGIEKDEEQAFNIMKSIENEKNNYCIPYCLGSYYENGIGVEVNKEKAFEYYKTCANLGYDKGQLKTAICYEYGIGVKKDYKKAFNRYKKAVRNGNEIAKYLMGRCYEFGIGTNVDLKKAFSIYNELENGECEEAIYRLAYCYEHAIGTEEDKTKAFELYNELARRGNEEAMFYLSECYERNEEVLVDLDKDEELEDSFDDMEELYTDDLEMTKNQEFKVDIFEIDDLNQDKLFKEEIQEFQANNKEQEDEIDDYAVEFEQQNKTNLQLEYKEKEQQENKEQEDEILIDENLKINIYLEQTIFKQVKDNNLENDLRRLVIKIDKCLSTSNGSLNINSLGFKKYEGVGNNKIYGFDFNNRVNDSDRVIACFVDDYIKKNEFDFQRYASNVPQQKNGIILFSITKHNDQEREAKKVAKRINNNFYMGNEFKYLHDNKGSRAKSLGINLNDDNSQDKMTFRAVDLNNNEIIYQEVLTKQQSKHIDTFIQKSNPFILSGIAGSGKTLSTVNAIPSMVKKIKNMGSKDKILYVTFSENLKESVKSKVMENYYEFNEYIDIKTFEDVCTEINYKYNNKKIDRSKIITQNSYSKTFTKFLDWLHRTTRDNSILKFIKKYEKEKNLIYSEIFGILKGSMYSDWNREEQKIVNANDYINNTPKIIEDYKIFAEEDRKVLYSITEKYNEWLLENGYYDINDIAFELQSLIKDKSINYEYVVVDEIQDFTEVQIYMLFLLAKEQEIYRKNKTRKIFLAGDPNQIINPTFFKIGRLRKLFYLNEYIYQNERLNENFRNSINIMKMNNIVNKIINDKLPARKEEDRQFEITKNNKTGIVELVKATENNLKIIFNEIDASAKVALIVSDEEQKEILKEKYGCESAFTISEFKGKEFDNIIVYNILSDYADIYEEIYKKENLKEGHYSYYFNRFYVSITRANYNLVLIEEKKTKILEEIKQKLGDDLKYIDNIESFKNLELGEVIGDSLELFNIGMKFLYDEKYSIARKYFNLSIEPNSKKLAKLCEVFEGDYGYEERADRLFDIGEYKLAQNYYEKSYKFDKFAIMYLYIKDLSYERQLKEFYKCLEKENISFSDLFDNYGEKFDKLQDILRNKVQKTKKIKSQIQGKVRNINQLFKNINKSIEGK